MMIRLVMLLVLWLAAGGSAWAMQGQMTLAIAAVAIAAIATPFVFLAQSDGPLTEAQKTRRKEAEERAKANRLAKAKAKTDKELKKEAAKAQKASKKGKEAVPPVPKGGTAKTQKAVAASSKK